MVLKHTLVCFPFKYVFHLRLISRAGNRIVEVAQPANLLVLKVSLTLADSLLFEAPSVFLRTLLYSPPQILLCRL